MTAITRFGLKTSFFYLRPERFGDNFFLLFLQHTRHLLFRQLLFSSVLIGSLYRIFG